MHAQELHVTECIATAHQKSQLRNAKHKSLYGLAGFGNFSKRCLGNLQDIGF
jgi:hypothetical protein